MAGFPEDELAGRVLDPPVRAVDQVERDAAVGAEPLLPQMVGAGLVDDEVHRAQVGGMEAAGVPQAGDGGEVEVVDEDEHGPARVVRRIGWLAAAEGLDGCGFGPVLAVQADEREDQDGEDGHDEPGALGEFHDREDDDDQRGVDPAGNVNHAGGASRVLSPCGGTWPSRSRPSRSR